MITLGDDRHLKRLQVRHKGTGEIYLQTLKVGDQWITTEVELADSAQEMKELKDALQKGRDRFKSVVLKGENFWF